LISSALLERVYLPKGTELNLMRLTGLYLNLGVERVGSATQEFLELPVEAGQSSKETRMLIAETVVAKL
jgi:hypothetical protein